MARRSLNNSKTKFKSFDIQADDDYLNNSPQLGPKLQWMSNFSNYNTNSSTLKR